MSLSKLQKISLAFFIFSLLPAYWFAHWRYTENAQAIAERMARENQLHASTDKLVANCERNEQQDHGRYSANYQICTQGLQAHQTTAQTLEDLTQEQHRNDLKWYQHFLLTLALLNLGGFLIYKGNLFLMREDRD